MTLAVSNLSGGAGGGTYSCPANSVMVCIILHTDAPATGFPPATISDTAGLTWTRRTVAWVKGPYLAVGGGSSVGIEVYWAFSSAAQTSKTINVAATGSGNQPQTRFFAVTGSPSPSAPWSTNPTSIQLNASGSAVAMAASQTVGSGDLVIGFGMSNQPSSGLAIANSGAGWTVMLGQGGTTTTQGFTGEYQLASGAGSITPTWTSGNQEVFVNITDSLVSTGTGSAAETDGGNSGFITTTLTKANIAASGTHGIQLSGTASVSGSTATVSSIATTFSNADPNTCLIAIVTLLNKTSTTASTVSSISDSNGLTWHLRKRNTGPFSTRSVNIEFWYATAAAKQTSNTITATLSDSNSEAKIAVFSVKNYFGAAQGALPFDFNNATNIPLANLYGNAATPATPTGFAITPARPNSLTYSAAFADEETTQQSSSSSQNSLWGLYNGGGGTSWSSAGEYLIQQTAAASTATFTGSQKFYSVATDVLIGQPDNTGTITTTLTKSSIAAAARVFEVLSGSSGISTIGSAATGTFTFTNSAPCVMVLEILTGGGSGGAVPITGITDSAGNTWTRRSQTQYHSAFAGESGAIINVGLEVWWANVTAIHGSAVTVTVSQTTTNIVSNTLVNWFGVTGSPSPSAPWDTATPTVTEYSNAGGTTAAISGGYTVASPSAMLIGFLGEMGPTGTTATSGAGTGFTLQGTESIGNTTTGIFAAITETKTVAAGSGTATFTNPMPSYVLVTDALIGVASTGETGTISQALTGISQSGSGTVTPHMTGTITTHLSGISQQAGTEMVTGTVTMHLNGVTIHATDIEEFIGTITTHLNVNGGFATGVVGTEIFTGPITTRLGQINQALVGKETFTGTIHTDLSRGQGQAFANVVQALEIIQGPIVTTLNPTRPLILGAKLLAPGNYKWFSYRYMDS